MTTKWGSSTPEALATRVAAGMPIATATTANPARTPGCQCVGIHLANVNQMSTAAADPQVPGPGLNRPAPKKVATIVAQSGAAASGRRGDVSRISLLAMSVFISAVTETLYFAVVGVLHWRGDDVLSAGPFAQINQSASFAAEREVLAGLRHGLLADRAFQLDRGFARHRLIVDGKPGRQEDAIQTAIALYRAASGCSELRFTAR